MAGHDDDEYYSDDLVNDLIITNEKTGKVIQIWKPTDMVHNQSAEPTRGRR